MFSIFAINRSYFIENKDISFNALVAIYYMICEKNVESKCAEENIQTPLQTMICDAVVISKSYSFMTFQSKNVLYGARLVKKFWKISSFKKYILGSSHNFFHNCFLNQCVFAATIMKKVIAATQDIF